MNVDTPSTAPETPLNVDTPTRSTKVTSPVTPLTDETPTPSNCSAFHCVDIMSYLKIESFEIKSVFTFDRSFIERVTAPVNPATLLTPTTEPVAPLNVSTPTRSTKVTFPVRPLTVLTPSTSPVAPLNVLTTPPVTSASTTAV